MPYTIVVLIHAFVTLKYNSRSAQMLHRPANIRN